MRHFEGHAPHSLAQTRGVAANQFRARGIVLGPRTEAFDVCLVYVRVACALVFVG
jgi:hypothetical protein